MHLSIFEDPIYNYKIISIIEVKICLHDADIMFAVHKIQHIYFMPTGVWFGHGHIIKWTQHISFLTLAGMARLVEGNYGND